MVIVYKNIRIKVQSYKSALNTIYGITVNWEVTK